MGKIVSKIVLTGGPCAGKTSALTKIEEELTEKGYKVFIVGESATELIKGGIKPFGNNSIDCLDFQRIILKYQYGKEKIYEEAAKKTPDDTKCVIVYDRGIIDNKAYIGQSLFNQLLKDLNMNELNLLDNYNMVIHLVTAADGAEEAYTLSNNQARTETVEEAKALDKKTVNAWLGHSNLKIINNDTNFNDKLQNVLKEIYNLLNEPISIRKQRKYTVDLDKCDFSFLDENNVTKMTLIQHYINSNPNVETRLRKRIFGGQSSYYITVQLKDMNGNSNILTNKRISEKEFIDILAMNKNYSTVIKNRYSFVINKQYYKLDVFDNDVSEAILEIEPTMENSVVSIPNNIIIKEDVTDNPYYDNHVIAEFNKGTEKQIIK